MSVSPAEVVTERAAASRLQELRMTQGAFQEESMRLTPTTTSNWILPQPVSLEDDLSLGEITFPAGTWFQPSETFSWWTMSKLWPSELWENNTSMLFEAPKFVVICYTVIENEYRG